MSLVSGEFKVSEIRSNFSTHQVLGLMSLGFTFFLINAFRWCVICNQLGFADSTKGLFSLSVRCNFLNFVLPTSVGGDIAKIAYLNEQRVAVSTSSTAVLTDKIYSLHGLAILGTTLSVLNIAELSHSPILVINMSLLIGTLLALIVQSNFGKLFSLLPNSLRKLKASLAKFSKLEFNAKNYAINLALAISSQLPLMLFVQLALNFNGYQISAFLIFPTVAAIMVLMMMPISYGGHGVREGAFIGLLAYFSIDSQVSLVVGIMFGALLLVTGFVGYLIAISVPLMRRRAQAAE